MKVEIWSDIMCPFCYIGKRHFEAALQQYAGAGEVEIEWHSFQLDPEIPRSGTGKKNVYEYLAERKGMSVADSEKMHEGVVRMAQKAGLTYNFNKAIVANSFDAHRLIQLAKEKGLGDAMEERLFAAYFTEGKDFGDHATLLALGKEVGLAENEMTAALASDDYAYKVNQDIQEAAELGIRGVPFFVFNRQYGVSGAQPVEVFVKTLETASAGK